MPRVKSTLNKTSQKKLSDFYKKISHELKGIDMVAFQAKFTDIVYKDVRGIKEGNEKKIVDLYIQYAEALPDYIENIDEGLSKIQNNVRLFLANKYTNKSYTDIIDIYFNDVRQNKLWRSQSFFYLPRRGRGTTEVVEGARAIIIYCKYNQYVPLKNERILQ